MTSTGSSFPACASAETSAAVWTPSMSAPSSAHTPATSSMPCPYAFALTTASRPVLGPSRPLKIERLCARAPRDTSIHVVRPEKRSLATDASVPDRRHRGGPPARMTPHEDARPGLAPETQTTAGQDRGDRPRAAPALLPAVLDAPLHLGADQRRNRPRPRAQPLRVPAVGRRVPHPDLGLDALLLAVRGARLRRAALRPRLRLLPHPGDVPGDALLPAPVLLLLDDVPFVEQFVRRGPGRARGAVLLRRVLRAFAPHQPVVRPHVLRVRHVFGAPVLPAARPARPDPQRRISRRRRLVLRVAAARLLRRRPQATPPEGVDLRRARRDHRRPQGRPRPHPAGPAAPRLALVRRRHRPRHPPAPERVPGGRRGAGEPPARGPPDRARDDLLPRPPPGPHPDPDRPRRRRPAQLAHPRPRRPQSAGSGSGTRCGSALGVSPRDATGPRCGRGKVSSWVGARSGWPPDPGPAAPPGASARS